MKKLKYLIMFALVCLIGLGCKHDVYADGNYFVPKTQIGTSNCYWALTTDGTLEITGSGDPYLTASTIPWAAYLNDIVSVEISNTVTPKRMSYWFKECVNLVNAPNIPSSVEECEETFWGCTSLETPPTIPEGVTNCYYMFYNCSNLKTVPEIPSTVTNCGYMFYGCSSLETTPVIPAGVISCRSMFWGCSNLTETPVIPEGVTDCAYMFRECSKLTETPIIPSTATNCTNMFRDCVGLTETPVIPEGVTDCASMFKGCTGITSMPEIPSTVTNCSYMFYNCTNLTSITEIPDSVLTCDRMFSGCINLQEFPAIPEGTTDCSSMFKGCTNMTVASVIPEGVTNCSNMFYGCVNLTEAPVIPDGVTDCSYMFYECTSLTTAPELPTSAVNCEAMFKQCESLVEAPVIPVGVTNCNSMFMQCTNLVKAADIPEGVIDCTDMYAFCKALKVAPKISSTVELCDGMFRRCESLEYGPTVPIGVKSANSMFEGCSKLKSVILCSDFPNGCADIFKDAGDSSGLNVYYKGNCTKDLVDALVVNNAHITVEQYSSDVLEVVKSPEDLSVLPNTDITFEATIYGDNLTYQWYMSSDTLSEGSKLNGATNSVLKIKASDVGTSLNGKYFYCIATDSEGNTVYTDRVILLVVTSPTAPTFSANISSGSWANKSIDLDLIGSNLLGDTTNIRYKYSLDGGVTWKDYDGSFTWSTDTTGSIIKAKAYNALYPEYFSNETNFIVKYDGTAPVVNSYSLNGRTVEIDATDATSGVAGYALTTSENEQQDWVEEPAIEVAEPGVYYAWAMDRAGNVSACSEPITVLDTFKYDDFTACGHTVTYDGQSYQGYVETALDDMVVTYGMTEGVYDLTEAPSFVNAGEYTVYYKIEKEGYESVTGELYVTIHKAQAEGYVSVPDVTFGTEIEPVVNSSTHYDDYTIYYRRAESNDEWSTTKPTEVGAYNAKVVFEESDNYVYTELIELFYINKLDKPATQPQSNIEVRYTYLKVKDVQLLDGWVWSEEDREKDLVVGEPITVTAVYIGADAGNYETTTCTSSITRLACTHQSTEVRNEIAPTCTDKGYTGDTYCVHCDELLNSGSESSSLGHTWDDGTVIKEPTYLEDGLKVFTCTRLGCDATYDLVLEFGECQHTETVSRNSVEPTCEDKGYTGDDYCTTCGDLIHEGTEVMELGHIWDAGVVSVEPTYKTEGTMLYTCTREGCNSTTTASLEKLLCYHNNVELVNCVDSTCDSTGYTGDTYCKDCDTVVSTGEVSEELGHAWDEGTVITEPTYKTEGAMKYVCTREGCNSSRIEAIDTLVCEHANTSVSNHVEPTCTKPGYSGDVVCSDCSVTVTKGSELPANLKHSYNASNICTVCGHNNQSTTSQPKPQPENPKQENPTEQQKDNSAEITNAKKVKAKISKLTNKKGKKLQIKVKKQKGYKYEIQVSTSKKFKKSVKKYSTSKTSYTVKKLKKGKKYYVRVRTYKTFDGKKVYGKWSKVKSIKIKK